MADPCSAVIGFVVFVVFYTVHGVVKLINFVKYGEFKLDSNFIYSLIAFFFTILGCVMCVYCQWNGCRKRLKRRRRRRRKARETVLRALRDYELEEFEGSAGCNGEGREEAEPCDRTFLGRKVRTLATTFTEHQTSKIAKWIVWHITYYISTYTRSRKVASNKVIIN